MRISDIISMGKEYLLLGMSCAVSAALIFSIGYFLIYKKIFHGKNKISIHKIVWCVFFLCYLAILFGATLLSRGSGWSNGRIMPLFYSYRAAWNSFSAVEWRNIILNIMLFVPLGFLLPLGAVSFQKFWKTYGAGLVITLVIELLQLVLKRGIFEFDDIFNNVLGTMIGYGCFAILRVIVCFVKKEKQSIIQTIALQIPLLSAIILFAAIFICYANQELGNLEGSYITKYNTDLLQISSEEHYSSETAAAQVYQLPVATVHETEKQAEEFFGRLGTKLDQSRNDIYDDTAVYYNDDGNSLWIDYCGNTYSFMDFDLVFGEEKIAVKTGADETEVRSALKSYGITVPTEAVFENMGEGKYRFSADKVVKDNIMYDGTLNCSFYENGKFGDITNKILICEAYKAFSLISEQEAYEQICSGKFRYFAAEELDMILGKVVLSYEIDSKGFYQPVYLFEARVNASETQIMIPAIQ